MNTRKLIFGALSCLILLCASVAPYATVEDSQEIGIKKKPRPAGKH